jgi:hypothetical protein
MMETYHYAGICPSPKAGDLDHRLVLPALQRRFNIRNGAGLHLTGWPLLARPHLSTDRLVPFPGRASLSLDVVADELSSAQSTNNEGYPNMTPQRSEIFRAFARGDRSPRSPKAAA